MTIDQIEMLEAIVSEGSMQKASKKLFKSQPSLSVGIKKIEEYYGIQIFNRQSYRPKLTTEGEIFYKNALPVLETHRQLHKIASELGSGIEAQINLCIDSLIHQSFLSDLLSKAAQFSKTTQININEDIIEGPIKSLINKKSQMAVGHCPPHREHEVLKKKVGQMELIPVIKKNKDIKSLPNIVVTSDILNPDEVRKDHSWYVTNHSRKEELILAGLGWGKMSKDKIKLHKETLTPIKEKSQYKVFLDFYLMIPKETPLGPVVKHLWEQF